MPNSLPELIAELTRLEKEASPSPWTWGASYLCSKQPGEEYQHLAAALHSDGEQWCADAALIVAMRNALPQILKALEREKKLASVAHAILNFRLAYGATSTVCNEDVGDLLQEVCNMAREALESLNAK